MKGWGPGLDSEVRNPEGVVGLQGWNDNNPVSDDGAWNVRANMQTGGDVVTVYGNPKNELTFSRVRSPTRGCRQSPNVLALTALPEQRSLKTEVLVVPMHA